MSEMTAVFYYLICFLAIALLIVETYLVIRRNRTIIVKGKDDFFSLCIVMLFAMLLLRPDEGTDQISALCSTLVLTAIFFSMAVKRGISGRGIEKFGFYIPWEKIVGVRLTAYQMSKVQLLVSTSSHNYKLIYHQYQLKKLIYEIQKHYTDVLIDESIKII